MAWSKESRQSRGYGRAWELLRAQVLKRDNYLCQPCFRQGRIHPATEVDHVTPKSKGGTDDPLNLQAIGRECHKAKTKIENGYTPTERIGADGYPVGG